jgi:PAS domain S-box-containing protein
MSSLKNKTKAELIEEIELLRNEIDALNERDKKQLPSDQLSKNAELALRESEEKFRTISNQSMMAILILQDDRYQYLNQAFTDICGYTIKESLDWDPMEWVKIVHPDDRALVLERSREMQTSDKNEISRYSYRIITKSGEIKWIDQFSKSLIFANKPTFLVTVIDITERKHAEENIKQRLRFEKIISSISSRFVGVFDIEEAINAALSDLSKLSGADRVYLFLFDKAGEKMNNTHECCADGVSSEKENLKNIPLKTVPWWMGKLNKGENIHVTDISKMPEEAKLERKILEAQHIKSVLILPLYIRKKLSGFIGFDNVTEAKNWNDDDIALLQISSGLIGNALERKRAQDEISQSGEFLNSVINGIADPIFVKDENHRWIVLNDSLCDMVGSTRNEMLGRSDYDLFPTEHADVFWAHDSKVLSSEKVDFNEEEINGVEGTRTISTIKSSFTNPITGKRNLVGTIRDITEQKQVETALKESEARLSTLMSNLPGMAYQCKNDEQWTMVFVNEACEQLTGYQPDQLINNKNISYNDLIHPDDRVFVKQQVEEAFSTGDHFEIEYRIISASSEEKWVWERGVQTIPQNNGSKLIEGVIHDITEHKQAEFKLKESEEYFRALIENSNDVISILDEKGNVIYESFSHQKVLGYHPGDMIGNSVFEFVHPNDRQRISQQFVELLQKPGEIEQVNFRFLHKDGAWRYIEGEGRNLLNTPAVKGIVVNYRDVTERIKTEEALWEQSENYRITSEKTGQLIYNYNNITGKINWAGAIELVTGFAPMEFQTVDVNGWSDMIHPDDREITLSALDDAKRVCSTFDVDYRFLHKNGSFIYVEDHGVFLPGEDGKANRMLGSIKDITERKRAEEALLESEEKFHKFFDDDLAGNFISSPSGQLIDCNRAWLNIFGFSTLEEAKKTNLKSLYPKKQMRKKKIQLLAEKKRMTNYEEKMKKITGEEIDVLTNLIGEFDEKNLILTKGYMLDITDEKKAKEEVKKYQSQLEELVTQRTEKLSNVNKELSIEIKKRKEAEVDAISAFVKEKQVNELKTRFISTVSHEIRTPLTAIKSSAELLQLYEKRFDANQKSEQLTRIVNSVDYLISLLEDVLMMSRTDSGKIIFAPKEVNLQELVKGIIDKIEAVDSKKHNFSYSFSGPRIKVITDSKLLGITITNLVNNAVKYSHEKSTIQINVSSNNFITLEVIDEGIGIPEEGKELLFEPFYRANNAEKYNGSGLGLSIVKRSIELLNGTIYIESEIDKGSKFTVKIPIDK